MPLIDLRLVLCKNSNIINLTSGKWLPSEGDNNQTRLATWLLDNAKSNGASAVEIWVEPSKSNPNIKIITEFNKYAMNSVGSSSSEFVKILDDLCLDFKHIDEKNPGNLLEISKNELENQVVSNVFCYNKDLPSSRRINL